MSEIKLTKKEAKLLSDKYIKNCRFAPWTGAFLIFVALSFIPFGYYGIKKVENTWEEVYQFQCNDISPVTDLEKILKDELLIKIKRIQKVYCTYLTEKTFFISIFLLTNGVFSIFLYRRERVYREIIKKIKNSKQI